MPTYNYKARELIAKIVYYGPGRCGKTTNLQQIHQRMNPETKSDLLSVATETDRTIYFDLLPLNLGTISGLKFLVRLFTVPGQVYYAETRKLVLKGADGVVFVADSQDHMMDENRQSLRDLKENLKANGLDYHSLPLVLQYNKRDLKPLIPEAELDAALNDRRSKTFSAVASDGVGVLETLRHITVSVFNNIKASGSLGAPKATLTPSPSLGLNSNSGAPRVESHTSSKNFRPSLSSAAAVSGPGLGSSVRSGPEGVRITSDLIVDEFKNLALVQSQLSERVASLEQQLSRVQHDHEEMRELVARLSKRT